jgi:CHAT domain-containing protein/Tfp pilus assembly protein PilF
MPHTFEKKNNIWTAWPGVLRLLGSLCLLLLLSGKVFSTALALQPAQAACLQKGEAILHTLELGTLVEKEIIGKASHCYKLDLHEGDFIRIVAEQKGSDVVLALFSAEGNKLLKIDRPNGSYGAESLSFIANATAIFYLQVSGYSEAATRGRYQITINEVRKATPQDESRILAERLLSEGEEERFEETAESLSRAVKKFNDALHLWRAFNDKYEQAVTLYGLGWTYSKLSENQQAITSFNQSMELMQKTGNTYGASAAQTGLAWEYIYFGETDKALQNFRETIPIKKELKDRKGEAISYHGIGWCHLLKEEMETALQYFFQSLLLRQEIQDISGEALTRIGIGNVYARQGKRSEALDAFNQALQYYNQKEKKDYSGEATVLSSLGWNYLALKKYEQAFNRFDQALKLRRQAGDRLGEATTLFGLAKTRREQGDLIEARSLMESSLGLLEALRLKGANNQLRLVYFASVHDYYEFYIDLLMQLHSLYPTKGYAALALEASERSRARSLVDLLAEANIDIRQGVPPEIIESEKKLQRQLSELMYRQRTFGSPEQPEMPSKDLAKEITALTTRHEEVLSQIREASPVYAAITQSQNYKAVELQNEIGADTWVLEYALGEVRSFLFVMNTQGITAYELPSRAKLEAVINSFYGLLTSRARESNIAKTDSERADAEYEKAVRNVSEILLGQVASLPKAKRLVIAAQGVLQILPFAVLTAPVTQSYERKTEESKSLRSSNRLLPLALTHEIVSIPSISTIALLRRVLADRKPAPKTLAIFADPVFNRADERLKSTGKILPASAGDAETDGNRLERLAVTRWEAQQISSLVGESDRLLALDFAANRQLATSDEMKKYRILHFATHAFINEDYPQLSEITLSAVNEQGISQDRALRAYDLFTTKLSADLVVLSGCKTGLGKYVHGEGAMNLTRMFLVAGVPRVVVSLWAIEDRAAADLMVSFYRKMLEKKLLPGEALRAAQAEMWRTGKWKSPFYWGAFTLQGDWR